MPYAVGVVFLGLALRSNSFLVRAIFILAAFLVYDTYIVTALFILLLPHAYKFIISNVKLREFVRNREVLSILVSWLFAFVLNLLIRTLLTHYQAKDFDYSYLSLGSAFLQKLVTTPGQLFTLHFAHKPNWVFTLFELTALFFVFKKLFVNRANFLKAAVTFVCYLLLSAGLYYLLGYEASRALFAVFVLKMIFVSLLIVKIESLRFKTTIASVLVVLYCAQLFSISKNKNYNGTLLNNRSKHIEALVGSCNTTGCELVVPPPNRGLKKDFVLPELAWESYYKWFALQQKKYVNFKIDDTAKFPDEL